MKRLKSGTYAKMPLDYEELRAFIDTIEVPEYKLMVAMITAGFMRVGEVVEMLRRDVEGPNIMVRKTKCRRDKDDRKIRPYRAVPKPGWVQAIMDETLPKFKKRRKFDDFLFQRLRGGGQLTVEGVNNILDRVFANMNTEQKVTCHSLRRTAAVRIHDHSGNDLRMVQMACDHKNIATSGIYVMKGRQDFEDKYKAAFA